MITDVIARPAAERLVVAATMGPTIHDRHAWRFKTRPGIVDVHADPVRFRSAADPAGRGVHLACGAALANLRLAAAQLGREAVLRLLPDPSLPTLLASLRLCGPHRTAPFERLLYAATMRPFPSRRLRGDERPPEPVLHELVEVARLEGAALHVGPGTDGPSTAVLSTPGDSPAEWLRAGQALQRIMLHGAVRAVSASFLYVPRDGAATAPIPSATGFSGLLEHGEVPQVVLTLTRAAVSGNGGRPRR